MTRRWDFISLERADFGVKRLCRVRQVSRSGFCRHLASVPARAPGSAPRRSSSPGYVRYTAVARARTASGASMPSCGASGTW